MGTLISESTMSIYMIGEESRQGPPFARTFFETKLGEIIKQNGKSDGYKLTLFLTDGTTLDVCQIDEHSDQYMVVRAYQEENDACDMVAHLIPYGLIYKLQLTPKTAKEQQVGFRWVSSSERAARPPRKSSI